MACKSCNLKLELKQMQKMSLEEKIHLYRLGYRLEELPESSLSPIYPKIDEILPYSRSGYGFMSPATCPTNIAKGTTKNIEVKVKSPGTPPYTFKVQRDGVEIYTYTGGPTEIVKLFPHKFDEIAKIEPYIYNGFVIDSCPTGPNTSNVDSCSIVVQEVPVPPPPGISPVAVLLGLGLVGAVLMRG